MNKKTVRKSDSVINKKGEVVIYRASDKSVQLDVKLEKKSVWLTQKQMSDLFKKDVRTVSEHIGNVYKEGELSRKSTIRKFRIVQKEGNREIARNIDFYNLDVIISVGYRVKSQRGTQFRIWATNVLRKHLLDGYTINKKRLLDQSEKISELQEVVKLLGNVSRLEHVPDEAKGIIKVITEYSRTFNILDDFDHKRLKIPKGTKKTPYKLTYEEATKIIGEMKKKFKDSNLVGQEKDNSLKSSIAAIYQTFGKNEVYLTVEEKGAHLLYFVTKNHSFVDGNKRISAALFICFLQKNGILLRSDGSKRIDENALVALTLMIASSSPKEKDIMIKVILNLMKE